MSALNKLKISELAAADYKRRRVAEPAAYDGRWPYRAAEAVGMAVGAGVGVGVWRGRRFAHRSQLFRGALAVCAGHLTWRMLAACGVAGVIVRDLKRLPEQRRSWVGDAVCPDIMAYMRQVHAQAPANRTADRTTADRTTVQRTASRRTDDDDDEWSLSSSPSPSTSASAAASASASASGSSPDEVWSADDAKMEAVAEREFGSLKAKPLKRACDVCVQYTRRVYREESSPAHCPTQRSTNPPVCWR